MDSNGRRAAHPGGESAADIGDWRAHLTPDSRQRIVNKIMETLKKHLPCSGPEGIVEHRRIAAEFEEKIFTSAVNQTDYLRKISMKMLSMDTKSSTSISAINNIGPLDSGEQMDSNGRRAAHPGGESAADIGDWRVHLTPDLRQRIVNKIMETLKKHLPCSSAEGIIELRRIAARFEEKIFTSAVNQTDYLRKISMKMLTMETKYSTSISAVNNSGTSDSEISTLTTE